MTRSNSKNKEHDIETMDSSSVEQLAERGCKRRRITTRSPSPKNTGPLPPSPASISPVVDEDWIVLEENSSPPAKINQGKGTQGSRGFSGAYSSGIRSALQRFAENQMLDDHCINEVLAALNPDASIWYVADTHIVSTESVSGAASESPGIRSSHRTLLLPIHHPGSCHWSLAVLDREGNTCSIYDSLSSRKYRDAASEAIKRFAQAFGVCKEPLSIDVDPCPNIRQGGLIDCGIFVIAAALYVLYEIPIEHIELSVWRRHLATLFDDRRSQLDSCAVNSSLLEKPTPAELATVLDVPLGIKDVHILKNRLMTTDQLSKQYEAIAKIANVHQQVLHKRQKDRQQLFELRDWYLSMPLSADSTVTYAVRKQLALTHRSLSVLRPVHQEFEDRLEKLRKCSERDARHYRNLNRLLEKRKIELAERTKARHKEIGLELERVWNSGVDVDLSLA